MLRLSRDWVKLFSPMNIGVVLFGLITLAAVAGLIFFRLARNNHVIFAPSAQPPKTLVNAHNSLGFWLLQSLPTEDKTNHNFFVSPASVGLTLTMAYNGAANQTKADLAKVLNMSQPNAGDLNVGNQKLIQALRHPGSGVEMSLTNSAWANQSFKLKPEFINLSQPYAAQFTNLDFKNSAAVGQINNWTSQNTKQKIKFIAEDLQPERDSLVLLNTLSFKADWQQPFDISATADQDFTSAQGKVTATPFLSSVGKFDYLDTPDFQAIRVPYKGERFSLDVFLLKDSQGINFVQNLDLAKWQKWQGQFKKTQMQLLMPTFKVESDYNLVPVFKKLGLAKVFEQGADFSNIGSKQLINQAKHTISVEVNQQGTQAATATSIKTGSLKSTGLTKATLMNINRPFFVAVCDHQTDAILFMGLVHQP